MPSAGEVIEGPGGFRLALVRTGPDVLEMEATYPGEGPPPPEHLHPRQEEQFVVLEGSVKALIGGEERVYVTGERFTVPAGTPHTLSATEPTRLRWEVRPALRTAEFFARLYGGAAGEGFLEEFAEEFRLT